MDKRSLTLKNICRILQIPVPWELKGASKQVFTRASGGLASCKRGSVFFMRATGQAAKRAAEGALTRGASLLVVTPDTAADLTTPLPVLTHESPFDAFIEVSRWFRRQSAARTIAVTGSVGKTTTKEMIRVVSEERFRTHSNRGNLNGATWSGVYAQTLPEDAEVWAQEVGLSDPGSVANSARILEPDAFVLTNIGLSHIGNLGSDPELVLHEKTRLDEHARPDAIAFVNADDERLRRASMMHRVVTFGVESADADYRAGDVRLGNDGVHFVARESATGEETPIALSVIGAHNVVNALAAFAVGRWLGISGADIARGLARFRTEGTRQNLLTVGERYVYADCFNASLESVRSALDAFAAVEPTGSGKRVFVFGDIAELGDFSEDVHRAVGASFAAQQGIAHYLLHGKAARWTAETASAGSAQVEHIEDRDELAARIREVLGPQDAIAFKSSHSMRLDEVMRDVFGEALPA